MLKKGDDLNLPAGTMGMVDRVEPAEYTGYVPCRVRFDGRHDCVWVSESQIRIADKAKPVAGEPAV